MARTKEQNERMRESTRQRIFDAAIPLFSEKGFAQTTIRDIARKAGMSNGLLYQHFATKDEIFGCIIEDGVKGLDDAAEELLALPCPKEAFTHFVKFMYDDLLKDDNLSGLRGIVAQQIFMDQELPWIKTMLKTNLRFIDAMSTIVKRGQKADLFNDGDPRAIVMHTIAQINGAYIIKRAYGKDYKPPTFKMLTEFVFKGEV